MSLFDLMEEEERKRWEMSPELPALDAEPPEAVAMRWLGGGTQDAPEMPSMPSIPEPPMATSNNGGLIAAAIADLVLNKGRSLGSLIGHMATSGDQIEKENWMRQRQHALDTAQMQRATQGRHVDPEVLAIRQAENAARMRALGIEERRMDTLEKGGTGALTPEQQLARERFDWEKSKRERPSTYEEESLDLRRQQIAESAAAREEMIALRRQQLEDIGAARQEAADAKKQAATSEQSRTFTKEADDYLKIAQQVNAIEGSMRANPKDLPGVGQVDGWKMNNDWPLVGAGNEGVRLRQDLALLADTVLRAQTGAAAPLSEKAAIEQMATGSLKSDEVQIRSAIAAMKKFAVDNLRARRVGRESAADNVLGEVGLRDFVGAPVVPPVVPRATGPGLGVTAGPEPPIPDEDEWEDIR